MIFQGLHKIIINMALLQCKVMNPLSLWFYWVQGKQSQAPNVFWIKQLWAVTAKAPALSPVINKCVVCQ